MALSNAVVWRVRAGGVETNGGGYDSTVSGAGTDYSDQNGPQLSITDLVSTASTTCTSVAGGLTTAMIGNILRLASATGTPTTGYYMILTVPNGNTLTLDRVSGTYTLGVAKIGGAHADMRNMSNGGGATAPVLTSPLLPGHTIMVRGAGTDDPSTADYTQASYYSFPAGDTTSGRVKVIGYNGRPRFNCDALCWYNPSYARFTHFKFVMQNATNGSLGVIGTDIGSLYQVDDCYIDQNGFDATGVRGHHIFNNRFTNSGSTAAGTTTNAAIKLTSFNSLVCGNFIKGWRGDGVYGPSIMGTIINNIIVNCKKNGIETTGNATYSEFIYGNTINGCSLDGIYLTDANTILMQFIMNNIITTNGGYGINCATGTATVNDKLAAGRFNYNNFGTGATANTSGARNNLSAGANDLALDPQFTNTATDDYSVGTNMKAAGFPSLFPT